MRQGLVKEVRPDKRGTARVKWVRPAGQNPPSNTKEHRRKYFQEVRRRTVLMIASACNHCGFDDVRALHIDHITGDAVEDKKFTGGSYYHNIAKRIREESPNDYQILCANCHMIKTLESQDCVKG